MKIKTKTGAGRSDEDIKTINCVKEIQSVTRRINEMAMVKSDGI